MAKTRRAGKKQKDEPSRPSIFFIVAMILGFAVLVWWFLHFLPSPAEEAEEKQAAIRVECLERVADVTFGVWAALPRDVA